MKSLRTLFIVIPSVVVLAAIVGFFIAFPSSPQSAYARIFIDLGVLIALISACMTVPKPRELRTEEIVDALRDLARGRYERRLNYRDFEELSSIAQAFNELAGSLSDIGDPNINRLRYQYVRRNEPAPRPIIDELHSHHPELGPVQAVGQNAQDLEAAQLEDTSPPSIFAEHSEVPQVAPSPNTLGDDELVPAKDLNQMTTAPVAKTNDVEELYRHFCDAHHMQNREPIDFDTFKMTIEKARTDLLATHKCRGVRFEIVLESSEVALRPRLVR